MQRTVGAHLECDVISAVDIVLAVAAASGPRIVDESLVVTLDGATVAMTEITEDHGTRLHLADGVAAGRLVVDYAASLDSVGPRSESRPADLVRYRRPSRYCESDRLSAVARSEFAGLAGYDLLSAVSSWVGTRLGYVAGSSRPIDGAVATLLARQGVCRDFAHLVIAFLRACEVPARLASVYAPGLSPMDFHAVVEAYVDGQWNVLDATCLAPRSTMVRIATGRDAADTAFLATTGGIINLTDMYVTAYADVLPTDDITTAAMLR
jgi:transglutaminase-like putative cysteine protease